MIRRQLQSAAIVVAGLLILALSYSQWLAPRNEMPDWVVVEDGPVAHSAYQDVFYRSVTFKGNARVMGNLTIDGESTLGTDLEMTGPVTFTNNVVVGDEVTDYLKLRGGLRTWQSGNDYWPDISDVSALDRAVGAHLAYNITGWGSAASFQALFANAQVTNTAITTPTLYGGELKTTFKGVRGTGTATGIGAMGKVIAKDGSSIPLAYGLYSRLETNGSGNYIYDGANFYADLDNTGSITNSAILATASDTWNYGLDLNAATISVVDIRLSNGETISNTGDGTIALGGNLKVTGTTALNDTLDVTGRATLYGDTWVGGGFEVGNDAEITGTLTLNDLEISGTSTFGDDVTINANAEVTGNLTVDGSFTLAGIPLITSEQVAVSYATVISRTAGATNGHIRLTSSTAITNATLANGSTAGEYLILTGSNISGNIAVLEGSNVWGGALTFTDAAGDGGTMIWDGTRWVLLNWHDN